MEEKRTLKKIKVINGRTVASFIETDVETVGELIDVLISDSRYSSVNFESVKILQKDTQGRASLDYDEQKISTDPEFKIFLMAEKMKFGDSTTQVSISVLKEMRTKMNNLFNDLIGDCSDEEVVKQAADPKNTVALSAEDLADLEELEG